MSSINLQKVAQEGRRRVNEDGLSYLFMGILIAFIGLSLWSPQYTVFITFGVLLIFPLEWLRKRVTYPRIGYVKFKLPDGFGRGILGFMALAIAVLVLMMFAGNGRYQQYIPIIIGGVFALSLYFGASMNGVGWRDWGVIALMVISSLIIVFFLDFDDWHRATAVQFWITATLLILIGLSDFIQFLRKYPPMQDTANGDR